MASNPLLRPDEGPSRFNGVATPVLPRVPGNALWRPPAAPVQSQPAAVPGPLQPVQPARPPVIDVPDPISDRVRVPKTDFPEEEHKDLHEKTMGPAFDEPGAADFVKRLYNLGRHLHPDIESRHLLETTRDTWHAVRHGFMPADHAGRTLAARARSRQAQAQRDRLSEEQNDDGLEPNQKR